MAIDIDMRGRIAVVTMNRPEALNAFTGDQLRELALAFTSIAGNNRIRAVVLTGAGDKAFAAGADIKAMAEMDRSAGLEFGRLGHAATRAIEECSQPVIAAVNGSAFAGFSVAE